MNEPASHRTGPETQRLLHRAFTVEDAVVAFELNSNPDVMRYTGDTSLKNVAEARRFIANYPDFERYGFGRWACVLKESQTVIGFCGLKYLRDLDVVDVGYRFLPQYWGQGLATEACMASLDFGFSKLGLARIFAFVIPANVGSVRVLAKSGMQVDSEFDCDGIATHRYVKHRPTSAHS
ncbi:anhydro-N-acetylmuramic acid kinase [Rubripirellula amarantea]|uniref:Anhydro-N-acetylmuramic acid kinase n=1 Tax=Rubripirellula amarantea TaxID=2527999 RepID=A0A5C5WKJ0_9BACT|nr:GNAT family N-acetyltransferase [Rubripirellula amarantea]TWT50635.1 anhydro-N-acetylmuramic acid kinase [Rubripirellula amarantea]